MLFLVAACGEEIPSVPGGVAARPGDSSVVVSWLPVPQVDVKVYNVYWGASPDQQDETQSVVSPNTNVTLYGLQNGTVYYFAVDAENYSGQRSAKSALVSATPMAPQDFTAPSIQSSTPINAQTGVSPSTTISITFTEPMDITKLTVSSNPVVDLGTPTWSSSNTVVTFPAQSLAGSTYYQLTVSGQGANGLALTTPLAVNFTTADLTPPTVVATTPADETTGVDPGSSLYVIFSEAMDTTFNPALVSITPDFAWTQGYDSTGTILGISPSDHPLQWNTTYTVTVSTTAKDKAGNRLQQPYVFRFSTAPPPYPPPY